MFIALIHCINLKNPTRSTLNNNTTTTTTTRVFKIMATSDVHRMTALLGNMTGIALGNMNGSALGATLPHVLDSKRWPSSPEGWCLYFSLEYILTDLVFLCVSAVHTALAYYILSGPGSGKLWQTAALTLGVMTACMLPLDMASVMLLVGKPGESPDRSTYRLLGLLWHIGTVLAAFLCRENRSGARVPYAVPSLKQVTVDSVHGKNNVEEMASEKKAQL